MIEETKDLIIEPKEQLQFSGPFDRVSNSKIKLQNNSTNIYLFKIKTTVPRFYCVKPSSGFVRPNETKEIDVSLQPSSQFQQMQYRHKFLVQYFATSKDVDFAAIDLSWSDVPADKIKDLKLRCVKLESEQTLITVPHEITFSTPFTKTQSCEFALKNSSTQNIYFMISANEPRKYSLTPNQGIIKANSDTIIQATLHAYDYELLMTLTEKFLIQYLSVDNLEEYDKSVWKTSADKKKDLLMNIILNVNRDELPDETTKENDLKQEIINLKKNEIRMKQRQMETIVSPRVVNTENVQSKQNSFSIYWLIIVLIIGIILGKYLL
uniref:Vesicle-associated membrane protein-associated protein A n=1 Tax=Lepeophtheirus salmonis TaxID=72036 RepID=D3PJM4_LEPSM|nr:Vesicle-associated membrane protein-associated protein A [Lepeophtheirus salmonis]